MLTALSLACLLAVPGPIERIGFASCFNEDRPQPMWAHVLKARPQVFVMLGDNIYADYRDADGKLVTGDFAADYAKLAAQPGFADVRKEAQMLAVWDDHDFGLNDAGVEFEGKQKAKDEFVKFWGKGPSGEMPGRPGTYDSTIIGPEGKRTQFLMLDTRWFRSSLKRDDKPGALYVPDDSAEKTMLGDAQWKWLEAELKKPAELRVIVSSIQFISEEHRFEKWANFPRERQRLVDLLKSTGAEGALILSGDRHLGEVSMMDAGLTYPLYDITASAFNRSSRDWRPMETNRHRVAGYNVGDNFGWIEVNWSVADPEVKVELRGEDGGAVIRQNLTLSWLKKGKIKPPTR